MANKFLMVLLVPWLLSGCVSTASLTPNRVPRNADGLYHFEAVWESNQRSIIKESIKAYVLIGTETYPMQPTPVVKDRWETLAPIPASQKSVSYRYKFDYLYNSIPKPKSNSRLSAPYQLEIVGK